MRKLNKNGKMIVYVICLILVVAILSFLVFSNKNKLLKTNKVTIGIHEVFNKDDYISKRYVDKEVIVDGVVNTELLGHYELTYQYDKIKANLSISVVDNKAPVLTFKEVIGVEGETYAPEDFVEKVEDDSKVTLKFIKEYEFNTVGKKEVGIEAIDEYNNKTIEKINIEIEKKDDVPPVLVGLDSISSDAGSPIDYYSGVSIVDNLDEGPQFSVDVSQVNENVAGHYEAIYNVTDRQGNTASYSREIIINKINPNGQKIVYLTIDDGPSYNTPEILDILNRYHAKATFFVTGMCPEYFDYIKLAHDAGHTIGMHTYSHNYAEIYSSDEAYINDMNRITDVIEGQIGYRPNIFRFPGGSSNTVSTNYNSGIITRLSDYASRNGLIYYDWNSDIGDGNAGMLEADLITRAVETGYGGQRLVMLMHDGRGSVESVKALPDIIEYYQSQGYEFKAIDNTSPTSHHRIAN